MQAELDRAWQSMPVVVLEGLRVTGKTTLARAAVGESRYVSLADEPTLLRRPVPHLPLQLEILIFILLLNHNAPP